MKKFKLSHRPNVLHISTALSWRGGEQQLAYLVDELGDRVNSIVLCSRGSKMESHCIKNNIDHYSHTKGSSLDFGFAKTIKRLCKKMEIDLCHMHDAHAHTFAILAAVFFRNKTPLVLSRRVDFPIKNSWFSSYKYNHRQIVKILCVSDTIKEITSKGIRDQSKLETVHSGIDLKKFKPSQGILRKEFGIAKGVRIIGNTSAIADHKDYFTFIDTAKELTLHKKNCCFFIIGDGPMRAEIEDYVVTSGLETKVYFTGFRTDIVEVISDLDIFLITSKTEGLGTSILDAFAAKVPVVATAAGGIPELVENNVTGKLCSIKSTECLVASLQELLADDVICKQLVDNALQKVQSFSKSLTADKTFQQYREVLV